MIRDISSRNETNLAHACMAATRAQNACKRIRGGIASVIEDLGSDGARTRNARQSIDYTRGLIKQLSAELDAVEDAISGGAA